MKYKVYLLCHLTHTHRHTHMLAHIHLCTYAQPRHTDVHTDRHWTSQKTHAHVHTPIHICTQAYPGMHAHIHTYALAHMSSCAHTQPRKPSVVLWGPSVPLHLKISIIATWNESGISSSRAKQQGLAIPSTAGPVSLWLGGGTHAFLLYHLAPPSRGPLPFPSPFVQGFPSSHSSINLDNSFRFVRFRLPFSFHVFLQNVHCFMCWGSQFVSKMLW